MGDDAAAHRPCLIYARRSKRDRGGQSESVRQQIEACEALAAEEGWQVVDTFADDGISGSAAVRRPEWERLLAAIDPEKADPQYRHCVVLAFHLDRLTRRGFGVLSPMLDGLKALEGDLVTVGGGVDTIALGDFAPVYVHALAWIAEKEAKVISERVRRNIDTDVQKGRRHALGGPDGLNRMFGYADATGQKIHPVEGPVVQRMVRGLLDSGHSYGDWARALNGEAPAPDGEEIAAPLYTTRPKRDADGKVTPRRWTASALSKYMKRAALAGIREYDGKRHYPTGDDTWPALMTEGELDRIRGLHGKAKRSNKLDPLWRDKIYCYCGAPMEISQTTSNGRPVLRAICIARRSQNPEQYDDHDGGAASNSILYHQLTEILDIEMQFVVAMTMDVTERPNHADTLASIEKGLADLDERRRRVNRSYEMGGMEDAEYDAALAEIEEHRNTLTQEASAVQQAIDAGETLDTVWEILARAKPHLLWETLCMTDGASARRLIENVVGKVVVGPGKRGSRDQSDRSIDFIPSDEDPSDLKSRYLAYRRHSST